MKLTASTLSSIQLGGKKDRIFFDDLIPGFGLRIREGGSKTFVFQYQLGTKQRRMSLGVATETNVNRIRKIAEELHARVKLGEDPQTTKAEAKATAAHIFKTVAEEYLEHRGPNWRPRTYRNATSHLMVYAKALHQLQLGKIVRADIAAVHSSVTKNVGETSANRTRESLSGLFTWAIENGRVENNPVINSPRHEEKSRDRVFTPTELRLIWNNLEDNDYGAIIKLLMLTGQRPGEIAGLRWSQIHNDSIILEGGDASGGTKNYRDHVIPLSEPAKRIIAGRKRRSGRDLVFGRGPKPFSGWMLCKYRVEARILAATGQGLKGWRPHDFRRTFTTLAGGGLAEHELEKLTGQDRELASGLGIVPYIIEAVTNHISAYKSGVSAAYNLSTYAQEKRRCLVQWAEHVLAIVEGRDSVIVPMKRA